MNLSTEVRMNQRRRPQRAELLRSAASTLLGFLGYLPFRYEDRIIFQSESIQPTASTPFAPRHDGQAIRSMRGGRDAILSSRQDDAGGLLPCKFFHGGYLEGRLNRPATHSHRQSGNRQAPPRALEMINPQIEVLSSENSIH